jgi:uncharacterized protein YndB with AHSA1/START domain
MAMTDGTTDPTASDPDPAEATGDERIERGIRFVTAEPQAIFDLLADPTQHALIDGSGTVRTTVEGNPERLSLGAKFGMSMKKGMSYKITNEVVEFDEPTVIAWRHLGRQFDWGVARSPLLLKLTGAPKGAAKSIDATLDRLAAHFAPPAD